MPQLQVYLFGYPRVEFGEEAVAVPRRKALALLAYLCVTQSHHSRDVLASLLWPEEEPAKAYAFLRNALWVLHQTPVDPWLLATRHMVGLRADDSVSVDVAEFRRLLQTCRHHKHPESDPCSEGVAALQAAVDLVPAGFLAGFTIDESRAFEEWQYSESDLLLREQSDALARLADHFESRGDLEAALRYAQRRLAIDTLDEAAHRAVMRLHARRGDRAAALRTFDECSRVLNAELGLTPADETRALAEEIRTRALRAPRVRRTPRARRELPVFRSATVGREEDVERILRLLDDEGCRLVTITGAGGSGKTRVAVDVAARATRFSEGAVFVSLVDVDSPRLIPAAILSALGEVTDRQGMGADSGADGHVREAAQHLEGRDLLVVLDNAEHLARDLRWLGALVDHTTVPKFLVTSRQELAVPGEWVVPLEGLAAPPSDSQSPAAQFPAVQLFLQAARRADARFSPTPEDLASIASVARFLQGSPLGLELAAAWVRTMSCGQIEREILKSVDFLLTDRRLVPRRHRSLRAAFVGSWDLLDRGGRNAFRALSVFRGGFTPEGAFRTCGATPPVLASLVAKSLLQRTPTGRYEMLEVVREYAHERLRAVPEEATALQDRHADDFLTLLASQESRLKRAEQTEALALLAADEANLYAAWRHAAARRLIEPLAKSAMGLFLFCDMTTRFTQGAELFRLAADAVASARGKADRARRSYFRCLQGWFTTFGDPAAGAQLLQDSVNDARRNELDRDSAFARVLVQFAAFGRAHASPRVDAEEALRFFEKHNLAWEAAAACEALSGAAAPDEALALVERGLAMRQALGDSWGVAMSRHAKGLVLMRQQDPASARSEFEASADLRSELGLDPHGLCLAYLFVGAIDRSLGRFDESERNLTRALEVAARVRSPFAEARSLEQLALLELERRRPANAREYARRAAAAYEACRRPDEAVRVRRLGSGTPRDRAG